MKVTFLGTGANGGTPQIDCTCKNCEQARVDSSHARLRSSLLVETGRDKILLDCGPDIRQQLVQQQNLSLQNLSLIAITHLHFDHAGGLMELSVGKPHNTPVLVSQENRKKLEEKDEIKFLIKNKFMHFVDHWNKVKLIDIPHGGDQFPTSAIVIRDGAKSIWYSPDVAHLTAETTEQMKKVGLIIFDATFINENNFPASKFNHTTIEKSAPEIHKMKVKTIFSHINHSEDPSAAQNLLKKFNFTLALDKQSITV